jgi:hypothetical protein
VTITTARLHPRIVRTARTTLPFTLATVATVATVVVEDATKARTFAQEIPDAGGIIAGQLV